MKNKKKLKHIAFMVVILSITSCSVLDKVSLNFLPSGVGLMSKWGQEHEYLTLENEEIREANPYALSAMYPEKRMVNGSVTKATTFFPISIVEVILTGLTAFVLNCFDFILWVILIIPYILSSIQGVCIVGNIILLIAQFIYYIPLAVVGFISMIFSLDNDLTLTITQLLSYNTIFIILLIKLTDKLTEFPLLKHLFLSIRSFLLFIGACIAVFLAAHAIPGSFEEFDIIGIYLFNPFFTKLWLLGNALYFSSVYYDYDEERKYLKLAEKEFKRESMDKSSNWNNQTTNKSTNNSQTNEKQENSQQQNNTKTNKLEECYKLLDCDKYSTVDEIKKSYRKKVAQYHPDKIQGKGLSEDFIKFAEFKFKELQEAYEFLIKEQEFVNT